MKRIITLSAVVGLFTAFFILVSQQAFGSQVISGKITDLARADVAFTGVCSSVEPMAKKLSEKSSVMVTKYTFNVEDAIKGNVPSTFTFTHLGGSRADALKLRLPFVPGMPVFEVGKKYTVFLSGETKLGLRGVINLGAGKFNFVQNAQGKTQVVNDYGNKSLFKGLPSTTKVVKALSAGGVTAGTEGGPMDYDSFVKMIKELDKKE